MENPFENILQRLDNVEALLSKLFEKYSQAVPEIEMPGGISLAEEITGLKKGSIYCLVHKQAIPFHKRGGRLYFCKSELVQWIVGYEKQGKKYFPARNKYINQN